MIEDWKLLVHPNIESPPIELDGPVCTLLFGVLFVVMLNNNIIEKLTWQISHNT